MFAVNSFSFVSQYFAQQNARKNEDDLMLIVVTILKLCRQSSNS